MVVFVSYIHQRRKESGPMRREDFYKKSKDKNTYKPVTLLATVFLIFLVANTVIGPLIIDNIEEQLCTYVPRYLSLSQLRYHHIHS